MGLVENDDFCGRDGDFTKFTGSKPSVLTSEATDILYQLMEYLNVLLLARALITVLFVQVPYVIAVCYLPTSCLW
ncbi:hypothetical protein Peur_060694 [Populus x canadensis]